jgi:hypothetical protein
MHRSVTCTTEGESEKENIRERGDLPLHYNGCHTITYVNNRR